MSTPKERFPVVDVQKSVLKTSTCNMDMLKKFDSDLRKLKPELLNKFKDKLLQEDFNIFTLAMLGYKEHLRIFSNNDIYKNMTVEARELLTQPISVTGKIELLTQPTPVTEKIAEEEEKM